MYSGEFVSSYEGWLIDKINAMTEELESMTPSEFNEKYRYLPPSNSPMPGPFDLSVAPYMREIIDCFDINSDVREVNLLKGVQITYTTALECIMLYVMAYLKTVPMMYVTAESDLAKARVENNIMPMINLSGFSGVIKSSDENNTRKTGKTDRHIQWVGGGFMIPIGANNAGKMRQFSMMYLLKDELDGWPQYVGKDGSPDALTDARCSAYWAQRKIFRGSTPLRNADSVTYKRYLEGDQRKYMVCCLSCGFPQELIWRKVNKDTGKKYGFTWETESGILLPESVRYQCKNCGHDHYEHDKTKLFATEHGAIWTPTAKPKEHGIRSYYLPALYSPVGMQPWSKNALEWMRAWDDENNKVRDIPSLQVFYNNILAKPFKDYGSGGIKFAAVSAHRRPIYRLGEIPENYPLKYSGSRILFLTCQVDVHPSFLAVAVMGWCRDSRPYVIDYWRVEPENKEEECGAPSSSVWRFVADLIERKVYATESGRKYKIAMTLIDAGYQNDTVTTFCANYNGWVFPILGRDRPAKNQSIKEFAEFTTQSGTIGYRILVDHYKDRLAPVLRRDWSEEMGLQPTYHFNAPVDITDKHLKELTVESLREKEDEKGVTVRYWYRPSSARNELWDLLVYGHAGVEIMAWIICIQHFELETVDWSRFWDWIEQNPPGASQG